MRENWKIDLRDQMSFNLKTNICLSGREMGGEWNKFTVVWFSLRDEIKQFLVIHFHVNYCAYTVQRFREKQLFPEKNSFRRRTPHPTNPLTFIQKKVSISLSLAISLSPCLSISLHFGPPLLISIAVCLAVCWILASLSIYC